jgi:arylsulfatase A-like enzyme
MLRTNFSLFIAVAFRKRFSGQSRLAVCSLVLFTLSQIGWAEPHRRPNVIVFLADDQGWGDLSLHGNPNLQTPNIDSLARSGAQLENFFVCAVCSPTRAEFLTGRYHGRMGVSGTSTGQERFSADEQTIAEVFRAAGYATGAFGKWHSGMQWPYHPNARGFDEFYGFCSGHWDNYFSPMLEHNGELVTGQGFLTDDFTNRAIEFVDAHRDQPFFVYLPYNTPHSPMQVPDQDWDRFASRAIVPDPAPQNAKQQDLDHTRAALAMCENIDHNVGRVLNHLEQRGLADQTIVVYFSDNGPNGFRFNGGLRGRKGTLFEGGLRSPCLIRYPARIPAGTKVQPIAGAIDLLPTLAELAGVPLQSPRQLDGKSLAPLLPGEATDWPERLLFSTWGPGASVRSDRWRLHSNGQLFDIRNDPGETTDVAQQHSDTKSQLASQLQSFRDTLLSPADRPFTLGHPEATTTQLPARDATAGGGIARNNRHPNCTYMTHWTSPEGRIDWDVDVLAPGEFLVEMYYASGGVGSEIELSLGNQKIVATVANPNEADETGREHDRVTRQEGYTKAWQPMLLGTIKLPSGRATLSLKATKVVGDQVADMRLLLFRRLR